MTCMTSRVPRIDGMLLSIRRPYPLVKSRGSQIMRTPRSVLVANKAPGPLLQRNDGLRQLKLDECISAFAIDALDARGQ